MNNLIQQLYQKKDDKLWFKRVHILNTLNKMVYNSFFQEPFQFHFSERPPVDVMAEKLTGVQFVLNALS